jgi:hypothetical protein
VGFAFLIEKQFENGRQLLLESLEEKETPIVCLANVVELGEDGSIKLEGSRVV